MPDRFFQDRTPVLAVAGWSGSGKTTLLERLIPRLVDQWLRVGVWKHDAHHLDIDREGKDTDRLYRAGAAVVLSEDPSQGFVRVSPSKQVSNQLIPLQQPLDLILIEGNKSMPFEKIWLNHPDAGNPPPPDLENCLKRFERTPDLVTRVENFALGWLRKKWESRPIRIAFLIGGDSSRMGRPKHLLSYNGHTLIEEMVLRFKEHSSASIVLVGKGEIPDSLKNMVETLPDIPGGSGPMAGLLSLLRWDPTTSWVLFGCDLPGLNVRYLEWLKSHRDIGIWGVVPQVEGERFRQPLAAIYEPQVKPYFETAWSQGFRGMHQTLSGIPVLNPVVPDHLHANLVNTNTPEEWEAFEKRDEHD
ncbi:MAG: molybdopterin-guanine dinucleotide biosynthesis protein B [Candidatus Omnitrophica bacterium]|nr:molybdopterin-guanine dinucleotide biosynthesis protein B [Candidatus Omnitrophota bacterium]